MQNSILNSEHSLQMRASPIRHSKMPIEINLSPKPTITVDVPTPK